MEIVSDNLTTLWNIALHEVPNHGLTNTSRDGDVSELLGVTLRLTDIDKNFVLSPVRKLSPKYACAELLWYLSGNSDITMIKHYAPQYERFAESNVAFGAYGGRILGTTGRRNYTSAHTVDTVDNDTSGTFGALRVALCLSRGVSFKGGDQIDHIITLLTEKPDTRQAVLTLWRDGDLIHAIAGDKKDLPCTCTITFFLRNGKLHAHTFMRSNDLWLGTPYDMFCWSSIQRLIADAIGAGYGDYIHTVGSLHLYARNKEKAYEVMREPSRSYHPSHQYYNVIPGLWDDRMKYVLAEDNIRLHGAAKTVSDIQAMSSANLLGDCVVCCCHEFPAPTSRLLQEATQIVG